jgi:16S rRNA pseudouridine516 synthase
MIRLDKFVSFALSKTRSEARDVIKKGNIKINNQLIKKNDWTVDEYHDVVLYNDVLIVYKEFIYLMLNKPAGYISATKDKTLPTVVDLIREYKNYDLFMVGRLDLDSEGLMIITNDGKFAHRITSPKHDIPKKYYVIVEGEFLEEDIISFQEGFMIYDGNKNLYKTKPSKLEIISPCEAYITIYEGKYHQVKKMCLKVGKTVTYLKRLEIGEVKLDPKLGLGEYRMLIEEEKEKLLSRKGFIAEE